MKRYSAVLILMVAASARANITGTMSLAFGPPSGLADAGIDAPYFSLPQIALTYTIACDAPSPQYDVTLVPILHTVDGSNADIDTGVNLGIAPPDTGPTMGTALFFATPGQKIRAAWAPMDINCGPGQGAGNMGGGPNLTEIDSNDFLIAPFVDSFYLQTDPKHPPQAGLPLSATVPTIANALWAAPAGSETLTVSITGAGINFSKTYSATDWKNVAFLTDVQAVAPTEAGTISIQTTLNPYGSMSNVGTITSVPLAAVCGACTADSDCADGLVCDSKLCDIPTTCDPANNKCGSVGCGDDGCACPGKPAPMKTPTTTPKLGCSSGEGSADAAVLVLAALWAFRRSIRRVA